MRIALDVDDVLFPWTDNAHAACVAAGITNGAEITQWGFHQDYGVTAEELWKVLHEAYRNGMLLGEPYPGVVEQITRLKVAGHSVHLITARGFEYGSDPEQHAIALEVRCDTTAWVREYSIWHDSLTFAQDKSILRADAGLDDSLRNCVEMSRGGAVMWLMDQPHNQGLTSDEFMIPRAASLKHFVDLVIEADAMQQKVLIHR